MEEKYNFFIRVRRVPPGKVTALDWAADSQKLATVKQDGQIMVCECMPYFFQLEPLGYLPTFGFIFRFGMHFTVSKKVFGRQVIGP